MESAWRRSGHGAKPTGKAPGRPGGRTRAPGWLDHSNLPQRRSPAIAAPDLSAAPWGGMMEG